MTREIVLEFARIEAAHIAGLTTQFVELLSEQPDSPQDPAIARLVPDAYREDPDAAREFRGLTEVDLLDRRRSEAAIVLASLEGAVATDALTSQPGDPALRETVAVTLNATEADAWLRTLAAVRLVLATRLGVADSDESRDEDDARFGIYDWVGYRLHLIVDAIDEATDLTSK
ncbi:DUF2017 family protein [Microbacterium sp. NPDC076911]|uniref:DUF2017 family protein n=1 Tax=Microbacterium sp. NPDC076911 TaxID=3154958 RepID=UPI003417B515